MASLIKVTLGAALMVALINANAQLVHNSLSGNADYDGWDNLGSVPGYGFNTAWSTPMESFESGSGDAVLDRISGGHYSASVSLYSFGSNTNFSLFDNTALAGVETVVFSIETWLNDDDPLNPIALATLPTLNYNGGSQALATSHDFIADGVATVSFGGEDLETKIYTLQWDVTGLGVNSFSIDWEHQVHSGIVAIQLEQSDEFSIAAAEVIQPVPLPGAAFLLGSSLFGLFANKSLSRRALAHHKGIESSAQAGI